MLRKFRPPHEEDTAEYDIHTPVFEPLDYPWDQDSQDDQAIFDLLRENLNFKEPEARRLLLIAWCLAFARPSSRPFFRQHYIKHEECLFVGKHLEDSYYSLPQQQTIPEDSFDSSFVSALKCLKQNPVADLQHIVPPAFAGWPSRAESQENYLRNWEENGELPLSLSVSKNGSSGPTDSSFKEWFDVRRKVGASFFSEETRERYMKLIEASMPLDPKEASAKASGNLNGDEGPTDISFQDWFAVRRRGLNWNELIDQLALLGQPTWGSKPVLIDNLATIHSTLASSFDPERPPKDFRPPPAAKAEPKSRKPNSNGGSKRKTKSK